MGDKVKHWHSKRPKNFRGFKRRQEFREGSGTLNDRAFDRQNQKGGGKNWSREFVSIEKERI